MMRDADTDVLLVRCTTLSPREREVLRAMAAHRRAKEIARDLSISEHTVRSYAEEARKKLGVTSSRDAALLFLEFERFELSPRIQGDQFQRLADDQSIGATSGRGFLNTFQDETPAIIHTDAEPSDTTKLQRLQAWFARLGQLRWLALTILMTLAVIMVFGFAAVSVLGVFEVLQQIGAHR